MTTTLEALSGQTKETLQWVYLSPREQKKNITEVKYLFTLWEVE